MPRRRDEYGDEDEDYGGDSSRGGKRHRKAVSEFFELEASDDSNEEEEEEEGEGEDDFIDPGVNLPDVDDRRIHPRPLLPREEEQEDVEEIERIIQEKYAPRSLNVEYDKEATYVEQQALLPSIRDSQLWMVKCATGHEREVAVCLMQKCIDSGHELQIRSAIALDHLKNYIYIEADKKSLVENAIKGMRNIFKSKILPIPIKEMTDVLSVKSKTIDISRDTWVRMKIGTYKGDLAKVVDVDNVRQRAVVKLIPRIDLQALAYKSEGKEVPMKKAFTPPARFMNIDEARELHIRVERRQDQATGDYYEKIEGMRFKDGFLYKNASMKSLSTQNVQPTFDELEKFMQPCEIEDGDMSSLATLFANRKKSHFMKGDRVIIVKGDLRNLKGWVEKVEEETVHIKPSEKGLPKTLAVSVKELCKHFEPGNHVNVVSGATEGATGMVVSVKGRVVNIVSDTTKELICVFADNVVESSEVTSGVTRNGDYELHDLVLLDDNSFGMIIRVESEAFQVLKGVPERSDVALVRLREIKYKIEGNRDSVKDVVKIHDGSCRGKQGTVEHSYKGVLFIHDRHHHENAGFICVKSESCMMVDGSRANGERNGNSMTSRFSHLRIPPHAHSSPMRPSRGGHGNFGRRGRKERDGLIGATVKIRLGHYKGCKGHVKDVKGSTVRIELESQMKVVEVDRSHISDNVNVTMPFREPSRYGMGSETPMHPSRTPLHPYMTPDRDSGTTPYHDGMRTPMHDRAWNLYIPMSPSRDNREDGNRGSWSTSPQYQDGSCKIALGSSGNGEVVTAIPNQVELVPPRTGEKIKIIGGEHRGATGRLIGIDGTDGIVKVDDSLDVKILDMVVLAKLVQA